MAFYASKALKETIEAQKYFDVFVLDDEGKACSKTHISIQEEEARSIESPE